MSLSPEEFRRMERRSHIGMSVSFFSSVVAVVAGLPFLFLVLEVIGIGGGWSMSVVAWIICGSIAAGALLLHEIRRRPRG